MAGFDRVAWCYDALEHGLAGGVMQRARLALLDELSPPQSILLIGEGPGHLVEALARRFPQARLTCVDASASMLKRGRERLDSVAGGAERCEWVCCDVADWQSARSWDLLVTAFFLDCFDEKELGQIMGQLESHVAPGGEWLLVDFQLPSKGVARWRARAIVSLLYRFFRLTAGLGARTLVPPQPFLTEQGWRRLQRRELDWGLLYAELWRR